MVSRTRTGDDARRSDAVVDPAEKAKTNANMTSRIRIRTYGFVGGRRPAIKGRHLPDNLVFAKVIEPFFPFLSSYFSGKCHDSELARDLERRGCVGGKEQGFSAF